MNRPGEPRSAWFPLTVVLAVAALALLVAAAGLGLFGLSAMRRVRSELHDPELRETAALRILGARRIPEGYAVEQNLELWPLVDAVLLSAGATPENVDGYFIYVKTRRESAGDDVFEMLERHGFRRLPGVFAGSGELPAAGATVGYTARRGRFVTDDGRAIDPAWIAELDIRCAGDARARHALWATAAPATPEGEGVVPRAPDRLGTPADPEAIRAFLEPFTLCGAPPAASRPDQSDE